MSVDFDKRVGQYVALREKIREMDEEHKERTAKPRELLKTLNNLFLKHLNDIKADNVSVKGVGTVYRTVRASTPLEDPQAFLDFVIETQDWDLLDRKANVTAVQDYMQKTGELPPGVKLNRDMVAGVRRG
jgi:hypothetical protein